MISASIREYNRRQIFFCAAEYFFLIDELTLDFSF
jgi:hypothetical protein